MTTKAKFEQGKWVFDTTVSFLHNPETVTQCENKPLSYEQVESVGKSDLLLHAYWTVSEFRHENRALDRECLKQFIEQRVLQHDLEEQPAVDVYRQSLTTRVDRLLKIEQEIVERVKDQKLVPGLFKQQFRKARSSLHKTEDVPNLQL